MQINGREYISAGDLAQELGITRQTLWRWRHEGKIPEGHRFRNNRIFFAAEDAQAVREYATKFEPAMSTQLNQLKLFNGRERRAG
jgi:transposase-like protein